MAGAVFPASLGLDSQKHELYSIWGESDPDQAPPRGGRTMETQQGSAALRVTLHRDPESIGELDVLQQYVYAASGRNLVLDFAAVEVFRSQMVIGLLVLDTLLRQSGRTLTLCSVRTSVEATFDQLGLAHLFGLGGHSSDISIHVHSPVCQD